jgi:hypothetical protein
MAAVAAIPSHTHSLALPPASNTTADLVNDPGDFMPRHARVFDARPMTFLRECVAMADAAGLHANQDFPEAWLRYLMFH